MSSSSDERWRRQWQLFHEAAELVPEAREPFLEEQCRGDPELREELERLLARHEGPSGVLDRAPSLLREGSLVEGTSADYEDAEELAGATIGPFQLDELLGVGGMGAVYRARQESPVRREVALKLVRAGLGGDATMRRFEAERQMLALMTHPSIAQVLDGGETEGGRPYFVMELVEGEPIQHFCDRHCLDVDQRLELFLEVCRGMIHAHQRGVIHRDLKPSNVLVSMREGRPWPKIIDFGVAKALAPAAGLEGPQTVAGSLIGTPQYMSPEQATLGGAAPDTRSDVYSLGVILYELLTGTLPFVADQGEGSTTDLEELRRRIREEEPERPSSRCSTTRSETAAAIAGARSSDRRSIRRRLSGDLDWILLRSLEKDRERRYSSVEELASDLERHLSHEPVSARPPATAYRASKFVRRHRTGVAIVGLSFLFLSILTVASLLQTRRVGAERDRANQEAQTASEVSSFLTELFRVSNPNESLGNTVTAREILDRGAERIREELVDQPVVQARLMNTIATVYEQLGLIEPALSLHRDALGIRERLYGSSHPDVARSLHGLADGLQGIGDYAGAAEAGERALLIREELFGTDGAEVASSLLGLAPIYNALGRYEDSYLASDRAAEIYALHFGEQDQRVAASLSWAGQMLGRLGRLEEGRELTERALRLEETQVGRYHPDLLPEVNGLAILLWQLEEFEAARPYFERALQIWTRTHGEEHPDTAAGLNNLGRLLTDMGEYEEARDYLERSLVVREQLLGPDHPDTAFSILNLGRLLGLTGELDEALALYERGLAIREAKLGPNHPMVAMSLGGYAEVLRRSGDEEGAARAEARAAEIREGQ